MLLAHAPESVQGLTVSLACFGPLGEFLAGEFAALVTVLQSFVVCTALEYPAIGGPVLGSVSLAAHAVEVFELNVLAQFSFEPVDDILRLHM